MSKITTYIALLRGINVGSHNRIKMADLRKLLESLGLENLQTYLQSGNVIFESELINKKNLTDQIKEVTEKSHGFKPKVLLLTLEKMQNAVQANPFPQAVSEPKSLHLGFLAAKPEHPNLEKLGELKKDSERFELKDTVFYLHAPDGVGRSKLAAASENALGVSMTDRNWRTVQNIIRMAEEK